MDMNKPISTEESLKRIVEELEKANETYPLFSSPHEALGVIDEEFNEFKLEVYAYKTGQPDSKMYHELKQLAAMALKGMISFWGERETDIQRRIKLIIKPSCFGGYLEAVQCMNCHFFTECVDETDKV